MVCLLSAPLLLREFVNALTIDCEDSVRVESRETLKAYSIRRRIEDGNP